MKGEDENIQQRNIVGTTTYKHILSHIALPLSNTKLQILNTHKKTTISFIYLVATSCLIMSLCPKPQQQCLQHSTTRGASPNPPDLLVGTKPFPPPHQSNGHHLLHGCPRLQQGSQWLAQKPRFVDEEPSIYLQLEPESHHLGLHLVELARPGSCHTLRCELLSCFKGESVKPLNI